MFNDNELNAILGGSEDIKQPTQNENAKVADSYNLEVKQDTQKDSVWSTLDNLLNNLGDDPFDALTDGNYQGVIEEVEVTTTKKGQRCVKWEIGLKYNMSTETNVNKKTWIYMMLEHQNETVVKISLGTLKTLFAEQGIDLAQTGISNALNNISTLFVNKSVQVKVNNGFTSISKVN